MTIGTKEKTIEKKHLSDLFRLMLGSLLYAAALALVFDPNELAPGGVSGIAVMVNHLFPPLSVGAVIIAANLPLILLAVLRLGKKFTLFTLLSTAVSSAAADLLVRLGTAGAVQIPLTGEPILAALFGGALSGAGIGTVMRAGGSLGGTDIIIRLLRRRFRQIKTGTFYLLSDAVVVAASALVFGNTDAALYSAVAAVVCSSVLDRVLYGSDEAKQMVIISEKHEKISDRLLAELGAGVTGIDARGEYSGKKEKLLLCVLRRHDFPGARQIVREEDPQAFMIVSSAKEIYGEGFKLNSNVEM